MSTPKRRFLLPLLRFHYFRRITSRYFQNPENKYKKYQRQDAEIKTGKENDIE